MEEGSCDGGQGQTQPHMAEGHSISQGVLSLAAGTLWSRGPLLEI